MGFPARILSALAPDVELEEQRDCETDACLRFGPRLPVLQHSMLPRRKKITKCHDRQDRPVADLRILTGLARRIRHLTIGRGGRALGRL